MSKSLARVAAALQASGVASVPLEMPGETRTAEQAAAAAGCGLDQIVKSILFGGARGLYLFLTAGGNQVDTARASALAGEPLGRADAGLVRSVTGFPIGGVPPFGHATELRVFIDPDLLQHPEVWAAAGTWHDVFGIEPHKLVEASGGLVTDLKRA